MNYRSLIFAAIAALTALPASSWGDSAAPQAAPAGPLSSDVNNVPLDGDNTPQAVSIADHRVELTGGYLLPDSMGKSGTSLGIDFDKKIGLFGVGEAIDLSTITGFGAPSNDPESQASTLALDLKSSAKLVLDPSGNLVREELKTPSLALMESNYSTNDGGYGSSSGPNANSSGHTFQFAIARGTGYFRNDQELKVNQADVVFELFPMALDAGISLGKTGVVELGLDVAPLNMKHGTNQIDNGLGTSNSTLGTSGEVLAGIGLDKTHMLRDIFHWDAERGDGSTGALQGPASFNDESVYNEVSLETGDLKLSWNLGNLSASTLTTSSDSVGSTVSGTLLIP